MSEMPDGFEFSSCLWYTCREPDEWGKVDSVLEIVHLEVTDSTGEWHIVQSVPDIPRLPGSYYINLGAKA